MKPIKKILFVCQDTRSANPLFQVLLQQAIAADLVLSTAGIIIDSADISLPGATVTESGNLRPELKVTLSEIGFSDSFFRSKRIESHPEILPWADLILVTELGVEDLLCLLSHDVWSKVEQIECFCGRYEKGKEKLSGSLPGTKDAYLSLARRFKAILPDIINRIKDSYNQALVVRGVRMNRKAPLGNLSVIGTASIVRHGGDLMNFIRGHILVVDRIGAILRKDISNGMAKQIIEKTTGARDFYENPSEEIEDYVESFQAKIGGLALTPKSSKIYPNSNNAIDAVVRSATGIICSRGYHLNEVIESTYGLPYISSCLGATQIIKDNQLIVMDTARGEVYDALLLAGP